MHPQKPQALPKPKGFFLKALRNKQKVAGRESSDFDHVAPILLPPATPPAPTLEDQLDSLQKALLTVVKASSESAVIQAVIGFLGRVPSEQEINTRGCWVTASGLDPEGFEVTEFQFDGRVLFTRRIGFEGGEFVLRLKLHGNE